MTRSVFLVEWMSLGYAYIIIKFCDIINLHNPFKLEEINRFEDSLSSNLINWRVLLIEEMTGVFLYFFLSKVS